MSHQRPSFSILALITANLAPLFGILFFGWDAASIVLLYWIENLIIGAYNILMMLGSPVPLLCILVILKIGVDIWLYTKSHKAIASEKSIEHRDQNLEAGAKKNRKIQI